MIWTEVMGLKADMDNVRKALHRLQKRKLDKYTSKDVRMAIAYLENARTKCEIIETKIVDGEDN